MSHVFNSEILDFQILPKDFEKNGNKFTDVLAYYGQKRTKIWDHLFEGIRLSPAKNRPARFMCVLCGVDLNKMQEIDAHIYNHHKDKETLLRKTPLKPIVGLEDIVQYYDVKNKTTMEYRCNLCKISVNSKWVIWHVMSYPHKEQFFRTKYSSDFIQQISDPKLKHQKVDQMLLNYEKTVNDRGHFITQNVVTGMIASSTSFKSKLNMQYIRNLYATDNKKLSTLYSKKLENTLYENLKRNLDLKIRNDRQFEQAKVFVQKLNAALMEYKNVDSSFKI